MSIYIGIDGGGTSTRLLIEGLESERKYVEEKTSLMFLRDGYDRSAALLQELLVQALGPRLPELRAIAVGLAGAGRSDEQHEFEDAIRAHLPGVKVKVESDAAMTMRGAFGEGEAGMLLIAGTGSVAIGTDGKGNTHRVGGWGRLMGDEGSGHAIGLAALRHFARVVDGWDEPSDLHRAILSSLGEVVAYDPRKLRSLVEGGKLQPSEIAEFVFKTGDSASNAILERAGMDLIELVKALHLRVPDARKLVLHGSVAQSEAISSRIGEFAGKGSLEVENLKENAALEAALTTARKL